MKLKKIVYILLLLNFAVPFYGQDKSTGTGPKEKSIKSQRKIRKEDRREAREKRRKEKAEKKAIKAHHKRLQTKQVRKRMKKSKNKATFNNEKRKPSFFKRLFKKKKKV